MNRRDLLKGLGLAFVAAPLIKPTWEEIPSAVEPEESFEPVIHHGNASGGCKTIEDNMIVIYNPRTGQRICEGKVIDISGPTMERNIIGITSLDNTGDYRDFVSFKRPAEATICFEFGHAVHSISKLKNLFRSDEDFRWEIYLGMDTVIEGDGLMTELNIETSEVSMIAKGEITIIERT